MNDRLITELDREIAETENRLAALKQARTALGGPSGPTGTRSPVKSQGMGRKQARKGKRAPKGALEEAMKKAIAAKPGLTNSEVRAKLEAAGYPFSVSPLHVGKRLSALVEGKELTVKLDGVKRRYHPAK